MRMVKKKELWFPTFWGWMLVLFVMFLIVAGYVRNVQSFLSVSKPVHACEILALEEWIPPHALERAASEFKNHGYSLLVVLGDKKRWVAHLLEEAGVDKSRIVKIPVNPTSKDRTFTLALALRDWLPTTNLSDKAVNVFTLGVHARRSWLLFREAIGPDYSVGIISCEIRTTILTSREWSEGFKDSHR